MKIKLTEFRIKNFRCIEDSNWIKIEDITALVGINESGKTAILNALHTINPGSGVVDINHIRDFPRKKLSYDYDEKSVLAEAKFEFSNDYLKENGLVKKYQIPENRDIILHLSRKYDKTLSYNFNIDLDKSIIPSLKKNLKELRKRINRKPIQSTDNDSPEELGFTKETQAEIIKTIDNIDDFLSENYGLDPLLVNIDIRTKFRNLLDAYNKELSKFYSIAEDELIDCLDYFEQIINELKEKSKIERFYDDIKSDIPVFIYFEDYSTLKGSIVLPNLISAINGNVKFRELKIQETLFKHVGLKPQEIRDLGYLNKMDQIPLQKQEELKKRKILLDSASQRVTETLNEYFRERDYKVEYSTDGQFFQILISDNIKPSKINLEDRSKGFRWYFSFFLVFLVESEGMHKNSILLLDEPGIHLHLQAQFNLINFFKNLKDKNQIIYTTHSPFLIDESHLEQVRSVFEDKKGFTRITDDNLIPDRKSIFPLQAALSYRTSQVIYQGLKQLIVEGDSDYNYLKAINYILKIFNKTTLDKDIVLIPAKSASKVDMFARLFIDLENVPVILLDSDAAGKKMHETLRNTLFAENKKNVLMIGDFLKREYDVEIEDMIGKELLIECINKNNITNIVISSNDIEEGTFVDTLKNYCHKEKINFKDRIDWKYQLSLKFKNDISQMSREILINKISSERLDLFEKLVKKINKYAKKKVID